MQKIKPKISKSFISWLNSNRLSFVISTFLTGKILVVGTKGKNNISVSDFSFERPMGLCVAENSLYISSLYQLTRFENILEKDIDYNGYDKIYSPTLSYFTGEIDIHDIGVDKNEIIFVNTLFSCLAKTSQAHSFIPFWKPSFISKIVPEDRCHLNGMAMDPKTNKPKYVTLVSASNTPRGWSNCRKTGGMIIDIDKNETVISGLSMPHSPRIYKNKLWVLDSGTGRFGYIDKSEFKEIAFCSGFARGLTFFEDYAIISISLPREGNVYKKVNLSNEISKRNLKPFCGILVVNLTTKKIEHWVRFEGEIRELYDVKVVEGTSSIKIHEINSNEAKYTINIG